MEEDIKRLEELIKPVHSNWIGISNQKALENLLTRYKDIKRTNSDLQGEQEQLYNKIDELEALNKGHEEEIGRLKYICEKTLDDLIEYVKTTKKLQKETIWKSKVKEKIEEIEQEDLEIYDTDSEDVIIAKYEQRAVLNVLQELLREE